MAQQNFDPNRLKAFAAHLAQNPPDRLHHYTSQTGLKGIIEGAELRATKAQYMNDATEFAVGLDLAQIIIKDESKKATDERSKRLDVLFPRRAGIANVNIFVACLCETADLLSQWRGYSGGAYGYSLAMNSGKLIAHAKKADFLLAKCIYDKRQQIEIINQLIAHCLEIEDATEMQAEFERGLLLVGAFFKDDTFREEQEWRIVSKVKTIQDQQVGFREGKSMLVPYYHVPIGQTADSAIEGVVIGPCPHPILSQSAVQLLFLREGLAKGIGGKDGRAWAQVGISKIPYRNW